MADATAFNLQNNEKAMRKLLVTCVNVGDSITTQSGTPEWQPVGVGVEDSAIEFNPDTETVTYILGITETTVNKLETSQSLEPMTMSPAIMVLSIEEVGTIAFTITRVLIAKEMTIASMITRIQSNISFATLVFSPLLAAFSSLSFFSLLSFSCISFSACVTARSNHSLTF